MNLKTDDAQHRASCILLVMLAGLLVGCPVPEPKETVAFVWDGEAFRQQTASAVAVPAPQTTQQADLDGDGALETVELQWGKLRLIDDGQTAWRSDPAWSVTRFALTDVDNDDALDLFFALWKPDEAGVARCHPFIYGWRRDAWRPVWMGSAVADPIADFVVGDVDGDGRNELVVLEGRYEGLPSPPKGAPRFASGGSARAGAIVRRSRGGVHVAVWRFDQWWFQFLWRSETDGYWDLGLKDVNGDGVPDIVTNHSAL